MATGLAGTKLAVATCGTNGLIVTSAPIFRSFSVRRVKLAFASACPGRVIFELAARRLCADAAAP